MQIFNSDLIKNCDISIPGGLEEDKIEQVRHICTKQHLYQNRKSIKSLKLKIKRLRSHILFRNIEVNTRSDIWPKFCTWTVPESP